MSKEDPKMQFQNTLQKLIDVGRQIRANQNTVNSLSFNRDSAKKAFVSRRYNLKIKYEFNVIMIFLFLIFSFYDLDQLLQNQIKLMIIRIHCKGEEVCTENVFPSNKLLNQLKLMNR